MDNKKIAGIVIFIVLIVIIAGIKIVGDALQTKENQPSPNGTQPTFSQPEQIQGLTTVYVAAGGGKEGYLADEDILRILREKYKINPVFDNWSNGKTVLWPLVREAVGKGNVSSYNKETSTINSPGLTKYDALFTSDLRFYDYYKLSPNKEKGEADRYRVQGGSLTLNTPIVIYSWDNVVDILINEGIVSERNGTYYITDMDKLLQYMLDKKKWSELGLEGYYGSLDVRSTDPVTSSPGATYYGLLLSIYCDGDVEEASAIENLPKLKDFYTKAGALLNSPADLFDAYKFQGTPLIVDYESSIIKLAHSEPDNFNQIKDRVRVLYPEPTMWNSHCYEYFTDNGKALYDALNDPEIQQIAWERYGFRTGVTGGSYNVEKFEIGIPKMITSTVTGLKMEVYDKLVAYLGEKDEQKADDILHDRN